MPELPGLPDGTALLALERRVRRGGTALQAEQLAGDWRLQQVWPRGGGAASELTAALLRGVGAALELGATDGPADGDADADGDGDGFRLVNRVRLGPLELRFVGQGCLEGTRPLLVFGFSCCQLCWGGRILVSGSLPPADPRRRPFFALLGRGRTATGQEWLAARGRGGGLALWCRQAAEV